MSEKVQAPCMLSGYREKVDVEESIRKRTLDTAAQAILGDRNNTYGDPDQDFTRTAGMLNALGFRVLDADGNPVELGSHHFAIMMMCVKMSRLMWSPLHMDSWVDAAGYAACGAETAELQDRAAEPRGVRYVRDRLRKMGVAPGADLGPDKDYSWSTLQQRLEYGHE